MRSSIIPILKPKSEDAEKHSQHLTIDECSVKLNFLSEGPDNHSDSILDTIRDILLAPVLPK
jgi:hypothetical protein|uniref:hypothetical protein n=1 Tax=Enterocloster clostridioformis TaxID=1531 RepID=UPI0035230F11